RRLVDLLGNPTESPYGNPIPSLDDLGVSPSLRFLDGVVNLLARVRTTPGPSAVIVRRLGEPVQFDPELLGQLKQAGIVPGARARVWEVSRAVHIEPDGSPEALELPNETASHVFVQVEEPSDTP